MPFDRRRGARRAPTVLAFLSTSLRNRGLRHPTSELLTALAGVFHDTAIFSRCISALLHLAMQHQTLWPENNSHGFRRSITVNAFDQNNFGSLGTFPTIQEILTLIGAICHN
jgi:hypothetical protein